MTTTLPTARRPDRPFDPPEGLTDRPRLSRLAYPDGHEGWLATGHALVREVLADPRFSIRPDLQHSPLAGTVSSDRPAPPGMFSAMDRPEHTRYRHLLAGQFTVRRMRQLTEHIQAVTDEYLAAMSGEVDLVAAYARPIPAQVICELLGVPYADRDRFQEDALALFRLGAEPAETAAAYAGLQGYIAELVRSKRETPTDDMLGALTESDLTDEELVNIGFTLLGAGLDTTANMIAFGVFALLTHPEQLARLRDDPGIADQAVEELLRYLSVIPFSLRTALEDLELDGHLIKAGESVTLSIPAANRDPERFADPDTLDLLRPTGGHVAFGHGIHQCLGQQLARVELRVALPALVTRFPEMRLAIDVEDAALRTDMIIYGVHALPVNLEAS